MSVAPQAPFNVGVVESAAELLASEAAFAELWSRARDKPLASSFAHVRTGWEQVGRHAPEARLAVVRIDDQAGRPILIWPLFSSRRGSIRVLRHPGSGSREEYSGPVIADGQDGADLLRRAVMTLRSYGDVLEAYNLRPGGALAPILKERKPRWVSSVWSPVITLSNFASSEDWRKAKSANFRQQNRAKRKRLAKLGPLTSALVTPEQVPDYVDWTFDQKTRWLDVKAIGKNWVTDQTSRDFYKQILVTEGAQVSGLELKVGDVRVASVILYWDESAEFFVTTYDPAYASYSPGLLVLDDVVDLACARGLDVDLRLTTDTYKLRWADRFEPRETLFVALTARGWPHVAAARANSGVRCLRRAAGALVRRFRKTARPVPVSPAPS